MIKKTKEFQHTILYDSEKEVPFDNLVKALLSVPHKKKTKMKQSKEKKG